MPPGLLHFLRSDVEQLAQTFNFRCGKIGFIPNFVQKSLI